MRLGLFRGRRWWPEGAAAGRRHDAAAVPRRGRARSPRKPPGDLQPYAAAPAPRDGQPPTPARAGSLGGSPRSADQLGAGQPPSGRS